MSYRLKWQLALRDSRTDSTAKHVGLTLALRMDTEGHCWPGRERIATETGYDVRTVVRAIARLEAGQWLRIEKGGGQRKTNHYWATLPVANGGTAPPLNGGTESRLRGQRSTPTVAPVQSNRGTAPPEFGSNSSDNPASNSSGATEPEKNENEQPDNRLQCPHCKRGFRWQGEVEGHVNTCPQRPPVPPEALELLKRLQAGVTKEITE
jgi:Helix-turn-helix domain